MMKPIACALLCLLVAPQEDPAKNLKSKDANTRLIALEALSKEKNAKNEKAVLGALKDDDWEVVEKAVEVLGKIGSKEALDDLVKLALNAPLKRLRTGAGATLAEIDAQAGLEALLKKLPAADVLAKKGAGPEVGRLVQSLAELAANAKVELDLSALDKLPEKAKDAFVRAEAARALVAGTPASKTEVLQRLALSASPQVAAAALEAAQRKPAVERVDPLVAALERPALADVVERRAIHALVAALTASDSATANAQAERVLPKLIGASDAHVSARGVRVIAEFARRDPRPLDAAKLLSLLKPALSNAAAGTRAEAAATLALVGGDDAWKEAQSVCSGDKDPRARRAALVALSTIYTGADAKSRGELVARLATDASPEVRLTAATALGIKGNQEAAAPLEKALTDSDWKVQVCAAVSLGKLQTAGAVEKLAGLAKSAPTWQLRAAAVEGLARTFRKECVPGIIAVVADADPTVQKTAHAFLCTVAEKQLPPKVDVWTDWWAKNGAKIEIVERPKGPATGKPSAQSDTQAPVVDFGIWRSLDVVVLDSRGDHIQRILERLKFEHRTTIAGKVGDAGLHPAAVFVANCTGEIAPADVERLEWFVLAGGRLFGSCWALSETIAKIFPGVLNKYETSNEVLENVPASNCAPESPYLQGVFGAGVEPVFVLEGAHLIDVLAPERCEVLIDSPHCAQSWGSGTLAALFTEGHGTVVDSVNHFEDQGFDHVEGLKTSEQRQAWAVDHMGYALEDLRKTRNERWWDKGNQASEHVQDLLVFRLVTNVVKIERGWTQ